MGFPHTAGYAGHLESGATGVLTIMGGLGRFGHGSFAEYTAAPATNVVPVETSLDWAHLAAIPESYATAWSPRRTASWKQARPPASWSSAAPRT